MASPPTELERAPSRAWIALALWLGLAGLQSGLTFVAGGGTQDDSEPLYQYSFAAGAVVFYGIAVALTLWIASLFPEGRMAALGLRRFPLRAVGLAALVVLAGLVVSAVLEPVLPAGEEQGFELDEWRADKVAPYILNALAVSIVGPFAEELFFRGLGFRALTIFGSVAAVVVSGLVFGFAHGILVAVPALAIFGVLLAWLRLRTGSIWPCVIAHGAYNGLGVLIFFLIAAY